MSERKTALMYRCMFTRERSCETMPDWERKYMGRWKMPNDDYIKRSDVLKAILGLSIYDTLEELDGARTIGENTWADGIYDAYKVIDDEVDEVVVDPKQGWIKVKSIDDLPNRTMNCLVACNEPGRAIERIALYIDIYKAFFEDGNDITVYVTHWTQLPEPPKGEDDAK